MSLEEIVLHIEQLQQSFAEINGKITDDNIPQCVELSGPLLEKIIAIQKEVQTLIEEREIKLEEVNCSTCRNYNKKWYAAARAKRSNAQKGFQTEQITRLREAMNELCGSGHKCTIGAIWEDYPPEIWISLLRERLETTRGYIEQAVAELDLALIAVNEKQAQRWGMLAGIVAAVRRLF